MSLDLDIPTPRRRSGLSAARRTLLAASATSLLLHAAILAGSWMAVKESIWIRLPAESKSKISAILVEPPPVDPLGTRDGLGDAIADLHAADPLEALVAAQNQPLLGLSEQGPLRPDEPDIGQLLQQADPRPPLPASAGPQGLAEAMTLAEAGRFEMDPPPAMQPAEAPVEAPAEDDPAEPAEAKEAATDPGPADGREVDLFAKEASTVLRAGSAESREGRDHKIRGLRRSLNAFLDSLFLPRPIRARYLITLDDEGTPTLIDVVDSTGSKALDLAIRRQLFRSWFDPDPSGDGTDLGRPFHFSIVIH